MVDDLYRQGAELIRPYFHLIDKGHADASTPQGKRELRDGISKLEAVVKLAPHHWPAHWIMGKAYEALGEPEREYDCFRLAFGLNPDHPDVAREFMRSCLALGKGDEAVVAAKQACRIRPDDPGLMANLGLALLVAGDVDGAFDVTTKTLDLSPGDEITSSLLEEIRRVKEGAVARPTRWPYDSESAT